MGGNFVEGRVSRQKSNNVRGGGGGGGGNVLFEVASCYLPL
jgi:hypothetical protein